MKCFIKHQASYFEVYWIKFRKNKIIGSFFGTYYRDNSGLPLDSHFTYPLDGKIHYSHKSHKDELYITAFHDQVKIKKVDGMSVPEYVEGKTILNHLLPDPEFQYPLTEYHKPGTIFHFVTIGFSIPIPEKAAILKYSKEQSEAPDKKSLIINVDNLTPGTLNIMAFIASSDYSLPNPIEGKTWYLVDRSKCPIIGISAIHSERP